MSLAAARAQFPNLRDYTDNELLSFVAQQNGITPDMPQYRKLESDLLGYDRTLGDKVKDTVVGLGQGLTGVGKMAGVALGAVIPGVSAFDNDATRSFDRLSDGLNQYKSQGLQNQEAGAAVRAAIAARESAGQDFVGRVKAGVTSQLGSYAENPGMAVQDVIANAPQLLVGGAVGKGVQVGGRAAGLSMEAATRAGVAAGVGTGGVMQGADVGADTYQRARAAGASHEQATSLATEAAAKAGVASVALSMLPGASTIERSLVGAGTPMRFGLGRIGTAARTGATEGITEGVDEAYGQFANNQAVQTVDANVDLAGGVGRAAAQGAVAGGPMGLVAGMASARSTPRTETGEINLTGTPVADPAAPSELDVPTFQRRGLDPLNAPWQTPTADLINYEPPAPIAPAKPELTLGERQPVTYGNEIEYAPQVPEAPDYGLADYAPALPDHRAPEKRPYQGGGLPIIGEQPADTSLPRDLILGATPGVNPMGPVGATGTAEDLIRNQEAQRNIADAPAPQIILPPAMNTRPRAPAATEQDAPAVATPSAVPNRGALLSSLAAANRELGTSVVKKDGEMANTRGTAPLRAVMESADPLAEMRSMYEDGKATRDELLDVWHRQITGETISDWKAAQPALNSAGFVSEPVAQLEAQVTATREGRKPAMILGTDDAVKLELDGLAQAQVTDPQTGDSAVVVSADPARVEQAAARTLEVGLRTAMGEAMGVVDPSLTQGAARGDVVAVQQVDNATGQVLADEIVTRAQVGQVRAIPGTTQRVVPAGQPVAERQAAAKPKKVRFGRRPSAELVEIAENTKDETEFTEARYELYRRWANDTDDGAAHDYLTDTENRSNLSSEEQAAFAARHAAEMAAKDAKRGGKLGMKFDAAYRTGTKAGPGVSTGQAKTVAAAVTKGWSNAARVEVVASIADLPAELRDEAPADVKAVYNDGKVWLIAGNHSSSSDVVASVLHEVAGHHGLRGLLGENFAPTMRQLHAGNPDVRAAADAMMRAEGLPLEKAVEEVLADMAETGTVKPTIIERIANTLRQIMRRVGLSQFAAGVTNAEVSEIVAAARAYVEDGVVGDRTGQPVDDDVAYRRGSPVVQAFGDAAKAVAASVQAQTTGKEISPALLSVMTLRQINEQFGKKLPALGDWIGAIMNRSSNASKLAAEADRVALQWEQTVKDPAERKALADILLRASVAEVSLDETGAEYMDSLNDEQRSEHAALRAKLAGLSDNAQRTRKQALEILRRQWDYTRESLESFINHTVPDPGLRNARIDDLKREMGRNRGDYFPLSRFGDRIVVGHAAAADGRDVISFHESAASAEAEVRRLKAAGVKRVDLTLQTNRDTRQRASTGFMGSLHALVDSSDADGAVKDSLHEALQQLYLKSLPELSGAKHMIRREAVEGFSEDALRAFADSVTRGARYASHLEAAPAIQAAMEAAEVQSKSSDKRSAAVVIGRKDGEPTVVQIVSAGTDRLNAVNSLADQGYDTEFFNTVPETAAERLAGALEGATPDEIAQHVAAVERVVGRSEDGVEDMRAAKALYNHMIGLQKTEGNQDPSKIVEALGQAGYTWYLGFSPAFWAMNTLQNPMIGMPHLGSKYGIGKAAGEWLGAARWFASVRIGKVFTDRTTPFSVEWLKEAVQTGGLKGISKQELDMLQTLEDRQVLDFTQAMDLSRIGQASSDKRYKFMRLAAAGAHHTEVFNRVTFALAAYRLALRSSGSVSHDEAVRRAETDVASVHFDYSYANKPELMRGKSTRLLFMFQQYRQHMLYWWAKNFKDIVKNEAPGERTRALKAALLMGATNAVFAGAMGLPFVGAVGLLANLLGGEDDDGVPFNFERWVTDAARDVTGSDEAGEVMSKGIFAALGMNISQRIGQADLLPFVNQGSAKFEKNADDKMRAYLFDLAGPLGSIALNLARSSEAFGRGDTLAGLAYATPKAASDIIKAYQLDTEGMKDKRGNYLATAEAFDGSDTFLTAAGVQPTKVANIKADRGRVADLDNALREKTRQLTGEFVEAWMRGDREGITEALGEVQAYNKKVVGGKLRDRSLIIDSRALELAIKDRQQRAMLLALTGGTAETKRQLLLATRMSGLFNQVTPQTIRQNADNLPGLPGLPGSGN